MPRYKRTFDEAELDVPSTSPPPPEQHELLSRLRSMWEFASLMQYIFIFGDCLQIDSDFDIEDLETECLRPTPSQKLVELGLAFLKQVSSHRGLTPDLFDEYTRRQYQAKANHRNPFGDEEEPAKFNDMDIFTRIQVLQQLSTWTFNNADRMREKMSSVEQDHLQWRVEELGWDNDERAYYVLDDNRLYRRTDERLAPPTPKPKAKSKASKKTRSKPTRASKRRRVEDTEDEEQGDAEAAAQAGAQDDTAMTNGECVPVEEEAGYGFTTKTWECVAITLEEYQDFLASIFRSRNPNEKQLRRRLENEVMPVIEKREEGLRQKQLKKLRELENFQKLAKAKRSSRLADKMEREKEEREKREAEEKKHRDLKMAHEEEERQRRIEEGHESRRLTREQRLKEREVKRILHEEEMAKAEEDAQRAASQDPGSDAGEAAKRLSERHLKTKKEQHRRELEKLAAEVDGKWYFDCAVCGMHGENLDDGTHSVACDRCGVWQHSKCHGYSPKQAEEEGFSFVCRSCKQKETDANKPKIPPLKLGKGRASGSPEAQKTVSRTPRLSSPRDSGLPPHVAKQLDDVHPPQAQLEPGLRARMPNDPSLSPHGQALGLPSYRYPPMSNFAPLPPQQPWQGSPLPSPDRPTSSGYANSPPPLVPNGHGPSSHQQQHQYSHRSALASSGGHVGYHAYHLPQYANGYSPRAPNGHHPMMQRPQQHYHQSPQPYRHQPQQQTPPYPPQQSQPRSNAIHPMNGLQSPQNKHAMPLSSPTQQQAPTYQQPSDYQPPPHQTLSRIPNATFSPPATSIQQSGKSPVKSPPAAHHPPSQHKQRLLQHSPQLAHTPDSMRPPSANAYQPLHLASQQVRSGSTPTIGLVADAMSGPWPEGSKVVPQKQDQSPAPPTSSQTIGEAKIVPPVSALTPSPGPQTVAGPQIIPVKKASAVSSVDDSSSQP